MPNACDVMCEQLPQEKEKYITVNYDNDKFLKILMIIFQVNKNGTNWKYWKQAECQCLIYKNWYTIIISL